MAVDMMMPNLGRKKVVVGIRFDGHATELLDWAVKKVAAPGDTVVAIHVCRNSGSVLEERALLDEQLESHQRLCKQKQIVLSAEVVNGKSVRKALVREATNCSASAVVLGITKHSALISGLASVAKYCVKRLPPTTQVMAIYNGKVVFSRFSRLEFRDDGLELEESDGRDSVASSRDDDCLSPFGRHKKGSLSTISFPAAEFTKQRPGWPLLQSSSLATRPVQEARKMSVVQWVMKLPRRSVSEVSAYSCNTRTCRLGDDQDLEQKFTSCSNVFSYDLLQMCTCNFSSGHLIAKGGCNSVYKGVLPYGKPVAVKVLESTREARKDFIREMNIMAAVKHKRIAPLLGICTQDYKLISVYKFLSKGSLEENLQNNIKREKRELSWEVRFRIAIGIAEALNYLHNECSRPVIHRDVKSSNILLTDEFEPQLCDFGLAMWGPTTTSSMIVMDSDVVGTFGYLAPEYFMYGKVSDKIDVYAFGVVLLELLSGRKPIVNGTENAKTQQSLIMWAMPKLKNGDLRSILDPNLNENVDEDRMQRMALAARLCLTRAARLRPNMRQILHILVDGVECCDGWETEEDDDNDNEDDEVYPESSAESHLSVVLGLLDDDDKSTSFDGGSSSSNTDPNSPHLSHRQCVEEFMMKKRWSR
ncbi:protein kinase STUNTED-like [Andrographis paniculata]|uniref:protein kinase STUNTED-like n=1 Tax=Andrographis paniculata TaxID=175694 RepID=UPI0021E8AF14|nr:protein kinase STUNTED-like [Andrographis paniculata]